MPFSVWVDHFRDEQDEPFMDRRVDLQAFLVCRVLASVIHQQITPTEEMFRVSSQLSAAAQESLPVSDAPDSSLEGFQIGMAASGFPSYVE